MIESYLKVTTKVKDMVTHQEFFSDVYTVSLVAIKKLVYRWPSHIVLSQRLGQMKRKRVGYIELRLMFPNMQPQTLSSIVNHYRSFEPIRRESKNNPPDDRTHVMLMRLSAMLDMPVPSLHEALSMSAALRREGFDEYKHKIEKKEAALEDVLQEQVTA